MDEVEKRIAEIINRSPTTPRAVAMGQVFAADPELYDRYRPETTIGPDGQPMNPAIRDIGVGKSESVDAEVARRVNQLVAKTEGTTPEQAKDFIFRNDPALYERWRAEYA